MTDCLQLKLSLLSANKVHKMTTKQIFLHVNKGPYFLSFNQSMVHSKMTYCAKLDILFTKPRQYSLAYKVASLFNNIYTLKSPWNFF